ncbi:Uncharacterised protein [Staphylococcus aureus]|nr:Uncharacterised protein [Staphylococcus aureus]CPN38245.1 Uncharacterised protein [Staphylococcus aureus]
MEAADPVLIIEFVVLPKIIPGPPVAIITASEPNVSISAVVIFCATIPLALSSSPLTMPRNSHPSYFVTNPSTSYARTCSSNAYNNCCPVVAPAYAVLWCNVPPKRLKSNRPSFVLLNITPIRSNK